MDRFRGETTDPSFAHTGGERHFGLLPELRSRAQGERSARADECAQDLDVLRAHPKHAADALHFEHMSAGAAAVSHRVPGTARFAGVGLRTRRVTPWLVAAGDGRLMSATFGRPASARQALG